MSGNVNRSLLAASILIAMTAAPVVHAVSDEVAVQLLERLGELEKEVSGLRGENETLRNELQGIKTIQREGFLEVDERVSGLEKPVIPPAVTPSEPDLLTDPVELPALEDPVLRRRVQPAEITPVDLDAAASADEEDAAVDEDDEFVSDPEDRKAIAPAVEFSAVNTGETVDKVDPDSPESYYFYGTEDKNQDKAVRTTVAEQKTVPATASTSVDIPDAHKAKAEYNQAYQALVNDPDSAVPAFRTFLEKYPDHELAANAQYWLGEALYVQKDYSGATEEFMVVLKNYKSSPKAPGAALKLGYSFYELKQWEFARRTLEDTIRFFPGSNAADLAKQRLERIQAEGH